MDAVEIVKKVLCSEEFCDRLQVPTSVTQDCTLEIVDYNQATNFILPSPTEGADEEEVLLSELEREVPPSVVENVRSEIAFHRRENSSCPLVVCCFPDMSSFVLPYLQLRCCFGQKTRSRVLMRGPDAVWRMFLLDSTTRAKEELPMEDILMEGDEFPVVSVTDPAGKKRSEDRQPFFEAMPGETEDLKTRETANQLPVLLAEKRLLEQEIGELRERLARNEKSIKRRFRQGVPTFSPSLSSPSSAIQSTATDHGSDLFPVLRLEKRCSVFS